MTYDGFDTMPIAGQWRVGRLGETADDIDPWSDDVLVRLPLANANDTEYGLSSAVFSRDVERAVRVGLRIDASMIHVNDTTVNDEPNTAFGEKGSGIGRFGGEWAIDEFTTDHWIGVQHTRRDYAI